MKRPLLSRWDMVSLAIGSAGVVTPVMALTREPSWWMLAVDAILSALLGLLIAAVVASVVRLFCRVVGWPRP
jgi:hypothetical protein